MYGKGLIYVETRWAAGRMGLLVSYQLEAFPPGIFFFIQPMKTSGDPVAMVSNTF
jgi:hypothetical protein